MQLLQLEQPSQFSWTQILQELFVDLAGITRKLEWSNPTPGMFVVDKSVIPMSAICTKDGYLPTTGAVQSHYQPATLGNVLLGGLLVWWWMQLVVLSIIRSINCH